MGDKKKKRHIMNQMKGFVDKREENQAIRRKIKSVKIEGQLGPNPTPLSEGEDQPRLKVAQEPLHPETEERIEEVLKKEEAEGDTAELMTPQDETPSKGTEEDTEKRKEDTEKRKEVKKQGSDTKESLKNIEGISIPDSTSESEVDELLVESPSEDTVLQSNIEEYMEQLKENEDEAVQLLMPMLQYFMRENKALKAKISKLESWKNEPFKGDLTRHQLKHIMKKSFNIKPNVQIVAFVNTKSGSGATYGQSLMSKLRSVIGAIHVHDLSEEGAPYKQLYEAMKNEDAQIRCLICGGDGSVAWILETIDKIIEDHPDMEMNRPSVAIVPFGTGNDMSRVLRWGGTYSSMGSITLLTKRIYNAEPIMLDRWKVKISGCSEELASKVKTEWLMNNYISLGIDAQVALNFHNLREESPHLCVSQSANKFWYISYGINHLLKNVENLSKSCRVWADGEEIDLKKFSIKSLIVNNIPSYSGGTQLWRGNEVARREQKIDDGELELCGISNMSHLGQIKTGMSNALCLHQAHHYKILFTPTKRRPNLAVQIDGEPFLMTEGFEVEISFHNQANMLEAPVSTVKQMLSHVASL